jgi:hypothetical protein
LSIMEKMGTLLDETIHIMPKCVVYLHGHWKKMVSFIKPFILVALNNDARFRIYTYWSNNDTQSHRLTCRVNNHHIGNENMVLQTPPSIVVYIITYIIVNS